MSRIIKLYQTLPAKGSPVSFTGPIPPAPEGTREARRLGTTLILTTATTAIMMMMKDKGNPTAYTTEEALEVADDLALPPKWMFPMAWGFAGSGNKI